MDLRAVEEEFEKYHGPRCATFEEGCEICTAWTWYDNWLEELAAINRRANDRYEKAPE